MRRNHPLRLVTVPALALLVAIAFIPAAVADDSSASDAKKKAAKAWSEVKDGARKVGDEIADTAKDVGADVADAAKDVGNAVADTAQDVWYKGRKVARPLWDDLSKSVTEFWNKVVDSKDREIAKLKQENEELKRQLAAKEGHR